MPFSFLIVSFHLSSILSFSFIYSKQPPPFHCFSYFITLPSFPLNTIPFLQLYFSLSHARLISLSIHLFFQCLHLSSSPSSWNSCIEGKWTDWDLKESNQSSALTKHQRNPDNLPHTHTDFRETLKQGTHKRMNITHLSFTPGQNQMLQQA